MWSFNNILYFAFAFIAATLLLDRFVFQRLDLWLLSRETTHLELDEATRKKMEKFSESLWKLTYYITVEFCILSIAHDEPWFRDAKQYFKGWPDHKLKLPFKLFYMCQCGFYTNSIVSLLLEETRRKDFIVKMSHHVVTVILIAYSYIARFFRIGAVVLALHDASDILLEVAKICKYSGNELGASIFFGLFAFSWLLLRLMFFPWRVIWASSYYTCQTMDLSHPHNIALYYVFNTLLFTLFVFHIYGWKLICSKFSRQVKSRGRVEDDILSGRARS